MPQLAIKSSPSSEFHPKQFFWEIVVVSANYLSIWASMAAHMISKFYIAPLATSSGGYQVVSKWPVNVVLKHHTLKLTV